MRHAVLADEHEPVGLSVKGHLSVPKEIAAGHGSVGRPETVPSIAIPQPRRPHVTVDGGVGWTVGLPTQQDDAVEGRVKGHECTESRVWRDRRVLTQPAPSVPRPGVPQ